MSAEKKQVFVGAGNPKTAYATRRSAIETLRSYPRWTWFLPWAYPTYLRLARLIRESSRHLEAVGLEWRTQKLWDGSVAFIDEDGKYIWGSEKGGQGERTPRPAGSA